MSNELKRKMDELNELLKAGYVTEEEYATARENLLLDAGFDTIPRGPAEERVAVVPRPRRSGCGCGCFFAALLLVFVLLAAGFFALTAMTGDGGYRIISSFFNDLRGIVSPTPDPVGEKPAPGSPDIQGIPASGDAAPEAAASGDLPAPDALEGGLR